MLKRQQEVIDEVMDWFDFDKVHKAMKALEWKWAGCLNGVPEVPELRKKARELLKYCLEAPKDTYTGTGGFVAEKRGDLLFLRFEVSSWEVDLRTEDEKQERQVIWNQAYFRDLIKDDF